MVLVVHSPVLHLSPPFPNIRPPQTALPPRLPTSRPPKCNFSKTHLISSCISILSRPKLSRRRARGIVCQASETAVDVPTATDENWQSQVLEADGPVLIEFWAPWCGPCHLLLPVVTDMSEQYAGRVQCFKINTDDSPSIASQYGVRSIPTLMIFVNGQKKDVIIAAAPMTTLISTLEKFL